ncbi:MAG: hypothetical protein H7Y16_11165, partial [Candidatus Parcubacteria bacterium]|nr:hypothetical protein [Burkholderiales bacterium]
MAAVAFSCAFSTVAAAATRDEDLAALRQRLESLRGELDDRESERREARGALRASEVAISETTRALQAAEAEARSARAVLAELDARRVTQERS